MPIDNPTALVEEFKKSGEFDRLRRELLTQFQQDGSYSALKARVEEIGRQRLTTDQTLQYLSQETVQKELGQEVERYPIVERAVADVRVFSDPTFLANMQVSIQRILQEDKKKRESTSTDAGGETTRTSVTQNKAPSIEKTTGNGQFTEEPARLSSNDTALVNIPSPQKTTGDDKMETDETNVLGTLAEKPRNKLASPSRDATSHSKTKGDDPPEMDVDSPDN